MPRRSCRIERGNRSPKRWQGPEVGNCGILITEKSQESTFGQQLALDKVRIRPTMTAQIVAIPEVVASGLRLAAEREWRVLVAN